MIKHMKRLVLIAFLFSALLFYACHSDHSGQTSVRTVVSTYPDGSPQKVYIASKDAPQTKQTEIQYYPSGQKKMEGLLVKGQRQGVWKSYYENGMLWSEGEFLNDQRHGFARMFYPGGQKKMTGVYHHGQRAGEWKWWSPEGDSISEEEALLIP